MDDIDAQLVSDPNVVLYMASTTGDLALIKRAIDMGANHLDGGALCAIRTGKLNLLKFFVDKGCGSWVSSFFALDDKPIDLSKDRYTIKGIIPMYPSARNPDN